MDNNIDLFDILGDKEDNITNVLKFLYDNSLDFKNNILSKVFGNISDGNEIKFETRRSYTSDTGKNIPDIILFSNNHFAIIEVKIFASEGYSQTTKYYNAIPEIKTKLQIETDEIICYYLTIYGNQAECKHFKSLTWTKDILGCLPNSLTKPISNDLNELMVYLLQKQLKERIESLNGDIITLESNWVKSVRGFKWCKERNFYKALKLLDVLQNPDFDDYWGGWDNRLHAYVYAVQFRVDKEWLGNEINKNIIEKNDKALSSYYDFHLEFKYIEQEQKESMEIKPYIEIRLDYHLNPYHSKSDIKKLEDDNLKEFIRQCNKKRVEIAKMMINQLPDNIKVFKHKKLSDDFLYILCRNYDISPNDTVKDVIERIRPFAVQCRDLINNALLTINN